MFSLPLKHAEKVDLQRSLRRFVAESYSIEQADEHCDAFAEVHMLREKVCTATLTEKTAEQTVQLLARYCRILTNVRARFGSAVDNSDGRVIFTWRDAWKTNEKCALPRLQFERAAVLFNLAAALSYLATLQKRKISADNDGLRRACQRFQQAAGALTMLKDLEVSDEMTGDMGGEAIEVWQNLMLAQAQQCFFEKAVTDKLKPSVVAKLAAQVAKLYRAAADGLRNARLVADKAWPALLAAHISTFDAWTQLHAAAEHEEAYEYGAQVARLSQALVHMEEVGKGGRERSAEHQAYFAEAFDVVAHAQHAAVPARRMHRAPQPNPSLHHHPSLEPSSHDSRVFV